jgi:hypothetical protein
MGVIYNKNTARGLKVFYPENAIKEGKIRSIFESTVKNKY